MLKDRIVKILIVGILILIAIGITSCGGTTLMSLNITYPDMFAQLDGNGTSEITWDYIGPTNKKVNIILICYTQNEEEMGEISIDVNVPATDESYIWGPNFGAEIFQNFGSGENWPSGFRIKIEIFKNEEIYSLSDPFSIQWYNPEWD